MRKTVKIIRINENDIKAMIGECVRRVLKERKDSNKSLNNAKKAKRDEFYTRYEDVGRELEHYEDFLRGKTVYCNCDNPKVSNIFKYLVDNFQRMGLKKVVATGYNANGQGIYGEYTANSPSVETRELEGNGDFRSPESIRILKQSDVVISNPPFSLFREYIAQLLGYGKKFIVIGNLNAATYKEIFPYIKNNKLWLGNGFKGGNAYFTPGEQSNLNDYADGVYDSTTGLVKFRNVAWFTNIPIKKREIPIELKKHYSEEEYPKYDNYDAINVDKLKNIPMDYDDVMGVPITFLDKYNPDQFEIIGHEHDLDGNGTSLNQFSVGGKGKYKRLLVKRKPTAEK